MKKPFVEFEACLPSSGSWLSLSGDEAKVVFIVSTDVAAILAAKTPQLSGQTFVVSVTQEGK